MNNKQFIVEMTHQVAPILMAWLAPSPIHRLILWLIPEKKQEKTEGTTRGVQN